ncbi:MAG TPA: hypothetical protein ENN38_03390 [Actinobacteria bacterium]|nr:hypothetical protein [Actinomycetota bacterium]
MSVFCFSFLAKDKPGVQASHQQRMTPSIKKTTIELYPVFCKVDSENLPLWLPVEIFDVLGIGYHQASNAKTFKLSPCGKEVKISKDEMIEMKEKGDIEGLSYFVMDSRGRGTPPTSAVDIALKPNAWVKSPVTGRITTIKTYYLEGRYLDFHVEIEPTGRPELRVVLIHLDDLDVKEGDGVEAAKTLLGKVRSFEHAFKSQIERHIPKECVHVHVQVNRYERGVD